MVPAWEENKKSIRIKYPLYKTKSILYESKDLTFVMMINLSEVKAKVIFYGSSFLGCTCVVIMTPSRHKETFLQSPITATAVPPHSGPITHSYTWTSCSCVCECSFSCGYATYMSRCHYKRMLTDFAVSVVFLYGVVFSEAHSSHPFDAFRCGQGCNLMRQKHFETHKNTQMAHIIFNTHPCE